MAVVAGPGSGKTNVIALRAAHLVVNCGINPANIYLMTFTNKGAITCSCVFSALISTSQRPAR